MFGYILYAREIKASLSLQQSGLRLDLTDLIQFLSSNRDILLKPSWKSLNGVLVFMFGSFLIGLRVIVSLGVSQ